MKFALPVDAALPQLLETLRSGANAVLTAPPGAGKSTRVPLALLEERWLAGRKIVMLEPRRLAAKSTARYMAGQLEQPVGDDVGYRTKGDTRIGAATRIEVVTEGVLTRWLQSDPGLDGVGIVIFDEFHERSIHADLGLALCLHSQALFRRDLRLLVMSATIEAESVSELLGHAPVLRCEGRAHPVETRYAGSGGGAGTPGDIAERHVAQAVFRALSEQREGDVLAFLPGEGEIRRTAAHLQSLGLPRGVRIAPLYGALSSEEQDAALVPSNPGQRKIVLSTSIAETSLTVEGVRIVVDAGFSRVPRYSPRTGLTRLATVPVSLASANQRRGRAGRLGPGVCYRLWSEEEHRRLQPFNDPELLVADLTPLALELAVWGVRGPEELAWLDAPPEGAYKQAVDLLKLFGAVEARGAAAGAATADGRRMAALGMHPRLAHMMLRAWPLGLGPLACELSVLLEEREAQHISGASAVDMRERVESLRAEATPAGDRLRKAAQRRMREAGLPASPPQSRPDAAACGELLAFAYPDRIGQKRAGGAYVLSNGRGARFAADHPITRETYIVAAELDGDGADSRIRLAAPVSAETLERRLQDRMEKHADICWDEQTGTVRAFVRQTLGSLVVAERPWPDPEPERVRTAVLEAVAQSRLRLLPWTKDASHWRERMEFVRFHRGTEWPDAGEERLIETLADWLGPHVQGVRSRTELQRLPLESILQGMLSWTQRRQLEEWAPTHVIVPSGSRLPVDYSDPRSPKLCVRLQEAFGWTTAPKLAGGRIAVTLHLLSPAHRPVQVTQDLENFWRTTYFDIKKDLKGRYPKHYWPDDPLQAIATRGTRPKQRS